MGMYDDIVCDYPLPGEPPSFVGPGHAFQTKDLDCAMSTYRITADGELKLEREIFSADQGNAVVVDFTGEVRFYTSNVAGGSHGFTFTRHGENAETVEYVAEISHGKLTSLRQTSRTVRPALSMRDDWTEPDSDIDDVSPPEAYHAGMELFCVWDGCPDSGQRVTVLAETSHQLCVVKIGDEPPSSMQTLYKTSFGTTIFLSAEHARQVLTRRAERLLATRKALQEKLDERLKT